MNHYKKDSNNDSSERDKNKNEECCGAHEVCEKNSLLSSESKIEYYDDEELDTYIGRTASSYNEEEVNLFSDVFYTLQENDIAGWLKSLQLRGIELPDVLKDEVLLIIREKRFGVEI